MAYEQATEYLSKVVPWGMAGNDPAYVNIHYFKRDEEFKKKHKKYPMSGKPTTSVGDAIQQITWLQRQPDVMDIYVCMSSQRSVELRKSKKGGTYQVAQRNQLNVVNLKSLFMDIDVKPDKYSTSPIALQAFRDFLSKASLPKPNAIVQSGTGGFHAYWVCDRSMSIEEWQPLADALCAATQMHNFTVDTACIIDSVRILRVPNTFNYKKDPKIPVTMVGGTVSGEYSYATLKGALTPYIGARANLKPPPDNVIPFTNFPKGPGAGGANAELSGGIEMPNLPIVLDSVAPHCGFIGDALADAGATLEGNPLWNLLALTSTFLSGGISDLHRMVSGNKWYKKEDTDDLFARKLVERARGNIGWPRCLTIRNNGAKQCASCPHFAAGKSPLNLGAIQAPAILGFQTPSQAPQTPTPYTSKFNDPLPTGYWRNADGIVIRSDTNADGTVSNLEVCPYPFTNAWLQESPWTLRYLTKMLHTNLPISVAIPFEALSDKGAFGKVLSKYGLALNVNQIPAVRDFVVSWVQKLQNIRGTVTTTEPYGWVTESNKVTGFAYDGVVYTPQGDTPASKGDFTVASQYRAVGDKQPWLDAAKMITDQKRPGLDAILATAFASPLLFMGSQPGVLVSAFSQDSGIGKSTALKIAQGVWGMPQAHQILTDTQISVILKAEQLKNLPLYWDEIRVETTGDQFSNFLFQIASGSGKSRANQDATLKQTKYFQLMVTVCSNNSLFYRMGRVNRDNLAGQYRVLEFDIKKEPPTVVPSTISVLMRNIDHNYGVVGREYAEYLGQNYNSVLNNFNTLNDMVHDKLKIDQSERYWRDGITCMLLGATYSNKLGFTRIDVNALFVFLCNAVKRMRSMLKESPGNMDRADVVMTTLTQYVVEMRAQNTLVTKIVPPGMRGMPTACEVVNDMTKVRSVFIRKAIDNKLIWISKRSFYDWLIKNQWGDPETIMNGLVRHYNATTERRTLTAGTIFSGGQENVIVIPAVGDAEHLLGQ